MCVDEHDMLTRGGLRAKRKSSHLILLEDPQVESERASRENSPTRSRGVEIECAGKVGIVYEKPGSEARLRTRGRAIEVSSTGR